MERRSGLGKGLGALIPSDVVVGSVVPARPGVQELPISQIEPNPFQPRTHFDEESLAGLTASIRELGVLQPILVRELTPDRYALIAGERRWRAAKRAGLQYIPVIVRDASDERPCNRRSSRTPPRRLNPLGRLPLPAADRGLQHDPGGGRPRVAKSRSAVANLLRLFQLPPQVQRLVADGQLSAGRQGATGHARPVVPGGDRRGSPKGSPYGMSRTSSASATGSVLPACADGGRPGAKLRAPGLLELEELLAEQLDTRVKIDLGPKRGKVVIEFADLEDLERIYRVMAHANPEARPPT